MKPRNRRSGRAHRALQIPEPFRSRLARWLLPGSIRGRLLTSVVLLMVLALIGSAVGTGFAVQYYLGHRVEQRLVDSSDKITAALWERRRTVIEQEELEVLLGENTEVVSVSPQSVGTLAMGRQIIDPQDLVNITRDQGPHEVVRLEEPHELAVLRIRTPRLTVVLRGRGTQLQATSLIVATSLRDDRATTRRLLLIQVTVGTVTIVIVAGFTVVILMLGLRPLTRLGRAVRQVGRGERDPYDPLPTGSIETQQLAVLLQEAFRARAVAEERLRAFVADASHELRTPLSTISGWVDLYLQGGIREGDATRSALERVETEIARMRLLVEELALLARLDAHVPLEHTQVDLARIAEEVVSDARVIAPDRSVDLVRTGQVEVLGDGDRLRRVLRNVVGNAVQHTPAGTAVRIEVEAGPGMAVLRVVDSGPGIPPEQMPHLFERFWRADESRARSRGGSGLGLAIVRAVVEAHGGTVRAESVMGTGTTLTVELPADGVGA